MSFIRCKHEHLCRWRPWQGTWRRDDPSVAGVKAGRVLCWGRRTEDGGGWSRQEAGAGAACERMCARVRELAGHVSPGDRDVWLSQPASQGAPGCQLTTARLQLGPNMKGKARNQTSNNASRPLFNVQCSVFNVQRLLHRIDPDCQEELWLVKFAPITGNCLRCSQYLTDWLPRKCPNWYTN